MLSAILLAASTANVADAVKAWSECAQGNARVLAVTSKEAADVVGTAAMGLCARNETELRKAIANVIPAVREVQDAMEVHQLRIYQQAVAVAVVERADSNH